MPLLAKFQLKYFLKFDTFLISNAKYHLDLIARAWHNTRKKESAMEKKKKNMKVS
jgi:hypothetical protein